MITPSMRARISILPGESSWPMMVVCRGTSVGLIVEITTQGGGVWVGVFFLHAMINRAEYAVIDKVRKRAIREDIRAMDAVKGEYG